MADVVRVVVLRTSDGEKVEVSVSLSSTLNSLKDEISNSKLGPITREHQRLFHLGRELKSGRRSLISLSFGKFNNYLVHLHSTQPKTFELSSDESDGGGTCEILKQKSLGIVRMGSSRVPSVPVQNLEVVDLLDGDDDDDDDIAVVESVPVSQASKRRRRC